MPASRFPDDIDTLKRMLASREEIIARLLAEISRLKRWQYGRSSERMTDLMHQLELALGDVTPAQNIEPLPARVVQDDVDPTAKVVPLRRRSRAFPDHLPRETVVHQPRHCDCPECGGRLRPLGEDVSEILDYVPGFFKVIRHVRPKLSCSRCAQVVQEEAPSRPIARGMAGAVIFRHKGAKALSAYRSQGISGI